MPLDDVNAIWNACKDMGVLLGKGGIHLNVSTKEKEISLIIVECLHIDVICCVNKDHFEIQKFLASKFDCCTA